MVSQLNRNQAKSDYQFLWDSNSRSIQQRSDDLAAFGRVLCLETECFDCWINNQKPRYNWRNERDLAPAASDCGLLAVCLQLEVLFESKPGEPLVRVTDCFYYCDTFVFQIPFVCQKKSITNNKNRCLIAFLEESKYTNAKNITKIFLTDSKGKWSNLIKDLFICLIQLMTPI